MKLNKLKIKRMLLKAAKKLKTEKKLEEGISKIGEEVFPVRKEEPSRIVKAGKVELKAEKVELPAKVLKVDELKVKKTTTEKTKKPQSYDVEENVSEAPIKIKITTKGKTQPIIFEFPKITEELKGKGVLSIQRLDEEGKVRGAPLSIHKIPKEAITKKISSEWEPISLEKINVRYPLIEPYAYAVIKWNPKIGALTYTVIEPPLTKKEKQALDRLKDLIIDLLDINLMDVKNIKEVQEYLKKKIDQLISDYEITLTDVEYNKILYYLYRDFLGLERIEPLMHDPDIEDISCDGANIPIYVFHRKYGSLRTNIIFEDNDELNRFISKLAQRCGKHISVAEPLLDGALPDGSRLQATFSAGGDIALRGSTFTIRKFTKDPLTIVDFMRFGTIPSLIAAYLWMIIEYRKSILIAGGTATGKTSALNALSLFIPPEAKIVSIEDTPELRLPHEHWIAKIARPGYGPETEGRRKGEISMFDLLKAALRERPDVIVVGEVRGQEAYVLFQGMATGHAGMATIHAESVEAVINRLKTPPISLSPGLLQHLDIIIIMGFSRIKGIDVRRVKEVVEIVGVDIETGRPITNQLFKWVPSGDYFEFASDRSYVLNEIIEEKGIPEESVWEEIRRRQLVLEWMKKENIRYYKDVGRIIATYYKNPEEILRRIRGGE